MGKPFKISNLIGNAIGDIRRDAVHPHFLVFYGTRGQKLFSAQADEMFDHNDNYFEDNITKLSTPPTNDERKAESE